MSTYSRDQIAEAYGEWLSELAPWQAFVTYTYDPKKHPYCPDDKRAANQWFSYMRKLRREFELPIQAAAAIEHHASGWPHIHSLLGLPKASVGEIDLLSRRETLYLGWFNDHGYADVRPIGSASAASAYVSKYVTKTLKDDLSPGLLIYPDPTGLQRP